MSLSPRELEQAKAALQRFKDSGLVQVVPVQPEPIKLPVVRALATTDQPLPPVVPAGPGEQQCTRCPGAAAPGFTRCPRCRARQANYRAGSYRRGAAAGRCPQCKQEGYDPTRDGVRCPACVARHAETSAARNARLRAAGLCCQCGKRPIGPQAKGQKPSTCVECRTRNRANRAANTATQPL